MKSLSQLSGPPATSILGHVSAFKQTDIHLQMLEWIKQYGDIFRLRLGVKPVMIVAEPKLIKALLRSRPEQFRRIKSVESVFDEAGLNGIFSAEGEKWKTHRKLTEPSFQPSHLKHFFPLLQVITKRLENRFEHLAASGQEFDLLDEFKRYSVDVTTWLAFGEDFNSLENSSSRLEACLKTVFPTMNKRITSPLPIWRFFPSKADKAFDASLEEVKTLVKGFIGNQKKKIADNPELAVKPENMLQVMLTVQQGDPSLSDEDIIANAVTFLLAGEDTTANTLTWMAFLLSNDEEAEERLNQELLESNDNGVLGWPLPRLPFLNAITYEAMRLKPVTPLLYLEPTQDTQVGDYSVDKGTPIFLILHANGFNPDLFSDPGSFSPDRWLDKEQASFSSLQPFGGGARLCPGRMLAMMEIKLAFSALFRDFSLQPMQASSEVKEQFAFTMSPHGFRCKIHKRSKLESMRSAVN
ncbi:cytochrome P450 [Shewanella psychrophila]|uniref:Cytochrome P450 n=1 Tax=Shewanella psychrophila TaxID=225848 RepID=A0A1S6HVF7_9GAMM|nr:cytochrome P450 [Shewanella psychrophila]AQS39550.1 cytochrome P450 [Shewanella psychrophila]